MYATPRKIEREARRCAVCNRTGFTQTSLKKHKRACRVPATARHAAHAR